MQEINDREMKEKCGADDYVVFLWKQSLKSIEITFNIKMRVLLFKMDVAECFTELLQYKRYQTIFTVKSNHVSN